MDVNNNGGSEDDAPIATIANILYERSMATGVTDGEHIVAALSNIGAAVLQLWAAAAHIDEKLGAITARLPER